MEALAVGDFACVEEIERRPRWLRQRKGRSLGRVLDEAGDLSKVQTA